MLACLPSDPFRQVKENQLGTSTCRVRSARHRDLDMAQGVRERRQFPKLGGD